MTRVLCALLLTTTVAAQQPLPSVSVQEEKGVYHVEARFDVAASPAIVMDVLTDYANIPRFMPDVRTSVILQRKGPSVVVAQEAVSKLMMFSKRVHLRLEVEEGPATLTFRDSSFKSFKIYEGSWQIGGDEGRTSVVYLLNVDPDFAVPSMVIAKMMSGNARKMIESLRAEAAARSDR